MLVALRLSVTVNPSTAPSASSTSASATEIPTGPLTVADTAFVRLRPSGVVTAPVAMPTVTAAFPSGVASISHRWFLSCTFLLALVMLPFVAVIALSRRVRQLRSSTSSLNFSSNVKALPSCSVGTFNSSASSGSVGGPSTVADVLPASALPSEVSTVPAGSVMVTSALPAGSMWMFQLWFWSWVRRIARSRLPPSTVKAPSSSVV